MVKLCKFFTNEKKKRRKQKFRKCVGSSLGVGDLVNLSNALQPSLQQHDLSNNVNNENCIFDHLDASQLSRHHQNSTSNREYNNRKMSMSPYLSPTSKLSSSLNHSPGILGSNLPLRRQLSNKSSLSLAGGAFYTDLLPCIPDPFSFPCPFPFEFLYSDTLNPL